LTCLGWAIRRLEMQATLYLSPFDLRGLGLMASGRRPVTLA